jgi:type I restriction enzyme S subunit
VFSSAPSRARRIVKQGDILMSTVRPNLQSFTIIKENVKDLIASTGFAVITTKSYSNVFLFNYLFSPLISKQFYQLLVGSNYPAINSSDVKHLRIPFPPFPEQKKIAEILSVWDKAIEKQTKLVGSLIRRKCGLMQQLLTGVIRFNNFTEKWQNIKLGEIFSLITETNDGQTHSIMTISGKYGLLSQEKKFERVIAGDSLNKYILLHENDFAYNKGNSKTYPMGCIYKLEDKKTALVPFVYICFRATMPISTDFYKHYFLNHGLDRQLNRIITSGARGDGLLNVDKNDFLKLNIVLPSFQEQTTIAEILNTADQEIDHGKQKLSLLYTQKRGLMQHLLTGKTRVKI